MVAWPKGDIRTLGHDSHPLVLYAVFSGTFCAHTRGKYPYWNVQVPKGFHRRCL